MAMKEVQNLKNLIKTPDRYADTLTKFQNEIALNGADNIRTYDGGLGGVFAMTERVRLRGIEKDKAKQKVFGMLRGLSG